MTEFKAWPKIPRIKGLPVVITEKVDGTNACVIVEGGKVVGCQSRNNLLAHNNTGELTIVQDNMGFAQWVVGNQASLVELGDGYHYGEWAGPGIQNNPHKLETKKFFLFNTGRWNNENKPHVCDVVPVLHRGKWDADDIDSLMHWLDQGFNAGQLCTDYAEGIIIYFESLNTYAKHTLKSPEGKWLT
jgi:hypothetical protein